MNLTIIERAANLREQSRKTADAISKLRSIPCSDWTTYQLLAGELEEVAASAVNTSWAALQRLEQMANEAARALTDTQRSSADEPAK